MLRAVRPKGWSLTGRQTRRWWAGTGLLLASRLGPRLRRSSGLRNPLSGGPELSAPLSAAAPGVAPEAAPAAAAPPSELGQVSGAFGRIASVQGGLEPATPKAGSVTVVGAVMVGSEQLVAAEAAAGAGGAVGDASVAAAGAGSGRVEAVAAALVAAGLAAGPAKPAAVAAADVAVRSAVAVAAAAVSVAGFDDAI